MNGNKAVPNIRFNGFKDEFKVGKLENFFDIKDGTHSSPQYINSGFPLVTSKNLTESGLKLENASYISKSDFDEINKRSKVDVGDILFGMIGTIGTPVMVKENNFAIKNVALIKEYSKPKVLNIWLIYYFQSPAFDKFIHFRSAGGTQKFLALGVIQNMKFKFPLKKEQQKIGNFFAKLDKLLDLQQQKIDKLELLKKALLQKLFPKHDAKIPEFRFKGFEGDWRSCDLGKIAKLYQPKTITQKQMTSEGYPVFGANGFIGFYGKKNHSTDQVTISARGENAGVTSYVFAPVWITGNSMVINVDKNADIDKHFLFFDLSLINLKKFVTGGAQPQLTGETLRRVKIIVTKIKEQQEIGNLLSKVDQLIELENRKLQNFQQIKKCLLQNMFVE